MQDRLTPGRPAGNDEDWAIGYSDVTETVAVERPGHPKYSLRAQQTGT